MEFTIIRKTKDKETYKFVDESTFVKDVKECRNFFVLGMGNSTKVDDSLPRVCFAAEHVNRGGKKIVKEVNRLVLLELNNLRSLDLAQYLRSKAAELPYTRIAFVGIDGRSVKIVARFSMPEAKPEGEERDMERVMRGMGNAYSRLKKIYTDYLEANVDAIPPTLLTSCYMANDTEIYYNPDADALQVKAEEVRDNPFPEALKSETVLIPGVENTRAWQYVYLDCFVKAQRGCWRVEDLEMRKFRILEMLAGYCHESGMPQEMAITFALGNMDIGDDERLVRKTFEAAYESELLNAMPMKHLNKSSELAYRTKHFMQTRFRLRKNVMTGVAQYIYNNGKDFTFRDLTEEVQNTMTIMAQEAGLNSWDKDLKRYINSKLIPEFDPVNDYLESLPKWDGKDRVGEFASRVPTRMPDFKEKFHRWMLSMVAHWMGKDHQHGNAIVPVLIGEQATGKTSFCNIILPPELRKYYNDKIDFKDDKGVNLSLTSFALVNIDEFDSMSRSQQPLLKYLLSKSDVKFRPPYGRAIEERRRYASFIATTNNQHPLSDPTGSRRFICTKVTGPIDFSTPVDYPQLYAQLREEINRGDCYWFTKEESDEISLQNKPFQRQSDLEAIILSVYAKPVSKDEAAKFVSLDDIVATLRGRYPDMSYARDVKKQIGRRMIALGFRSQRTHSNGTCYYVVETL